MESLAFFAGRQERAEQAERQNGQNGQNGGQAGWLAGAGRLERQAGDRQAGWNGGQATGRSIQAVAKTGRGRPIMTEIIGAGKFRAS